MKILEKLCNYISVAFIIELILGYNGHTLVILGTPIRNVLYLFVILIFGITCLSIFINYIKENKNNSFRIFKEFILLDFAVIVLFISLLFFAIVVPVIKGGSLVYSKNEILSTIMILFLYFPFRTLFQKNIIDKKLISNVIYYCLIILSVLHIVLFVGQNFDSEFIYNHYVFLDKLVLGNSVIPDIVLGYMGSTRVVLATSVYILLGIYLSLKKLLNNKKREYIVLLIHIVALLSTMMRGFWTALLVGVIFIVLYIVIKRGKSIFSFRYISKVCVVIASTVIISNTLIFNNMVFDRAASTVSDYSNSNSDDSDKSNMEEGAELSSLHRTKQIEVLFDMWVESPIIGHGFGSFDEDYTRSTISPFSYEMQLPAYLMKTGIVGTGILSFAVIVLMLTISKSSKVFPGESIALMFILITFGVGVQTNPLFLSHVGASVILFILICASQLEIRRLKLKNT